MSPFTSCANALSGMLQSAGVTAQTWYLPAASLPAWLAHLPCSKLLSLKCTAWG